MTITYQEIREIPIEQILALYQANHWSSANKPQALYNALMNSHSLVSAWDEDKLVGLGNAITDGFLVVYYPHLLVLPDYQRRGIGQSLMKMLMQKYHDFHQQILVADAQAIKFYQRCGFIRAGKTESLWIYQGDEH